MSWGVLGLPLPEWIVVITATMLVLVGVGRGPVTRGRRVAAGMAALGFAAATAVVVSSGLPWPLVPVLLAAVIPLVVALRLVAVPHSHRAHRRRLAWAAAVVAWVLIASGALVSGLLPTPRFPDPSGPYAVGVTVLQWTDQRRAEPATADPDDRRTIVAQVWYPAEPSTTADRSRYLGRSEREARLVSSAEARYLGGPGFVLSQLVDARTAAVPDAPALAAAGRFPVVLFSPGLGGVRTQNTAWAEELASRGYAVVALDHPYDSAAVTLADGTTIGTQVAPSGDDAEDNRRANAWTAVRAADLSFALSRLDTDLPAPLTGLLDTGRSAVTGHSLGGAAALLAARRDPRFRAVIDLDGFPRDPSPSRYRQPALAVTHQLRPGGDPDYLPALDRVLRLSATGGYRLTVPGTAHLSFTDAPLFLPPLPSLVGSHGRSEAIRLTADITATFLDAYVRGRSGDVAGELARYGDLVHLPATR